MKALDRVNSYEDRIVIFCDELYGRSSDFKTQRVLDVVVALDAPTYEDVNQAIGRGMRKVETSNDAVIVLPEKF